MRCAVFASFLFAASAACVFAVMPDLGLVTDPGRIFFSVDREGASVNGARLDGEQFLARLSELSVVSAASAQSAPALTGKVVSAQKQALEGVRVSATREGATASISVVTDASGTFAFPADQLSAGRHRIHIDAAGYALDSPKLIDLPDSGVVTLDLRLVPVDGPTPQQHAVNEAAL